MPLYMVERTFAEQIGPTEHEVQLIDEINVDESIRWVFSFLSADRRRSYCLYEAPSPDAIRSAAVRAGLPVDVVIEVGAATPQFAGRLQNWATSAGSRSSGIQ